MPLGAVWTGHCVAARDESWTPDDGRLRPLCNLGYARGGCDRFPTTNAADAVRFTISEDDGAIVRVYYVVEQDHHPQAHGRLEFFRSTNAFASDVSADATLLCQARAYVASYLASHPQGDSKELHNGR